MLATRVCWGLWRAAEIGEVKVRFQVFIMIQEYVKGNLGAPEQV